MAYQNNRPNNNQKQENNYLRASSLRKTFHYNEEIDPATGKARQERAEYHAEVTEEVSISLTYEKAQDLVNRLQEAMNHQSGDGGVYLSMYCRKSQNRNTGEIFDGMNILVNFKKPSNKPQQRGNFRGNAGGGRRDFPQTTSRPATSTTHGGTSRNNGFTNQGGQVGGPISPKATTTPKTPVYPNDPEF